MALTLVEGEKYSRTELDRAVIDRLVKESSILQRLKFIEILGNSLTYDTITTRSSAGFYQVGDTWQEDTPIVTQATAALTILGGDADVDNFIAKTRSNIIDVKAEVLADKVKAVQETFLDSFYYGSGTAPDFTGLQGLVTSTTYNTVHAGGSTGTALSMAKLYEALDLITGYTPAVIASSKKMRRLVQIYVDSIGDKMPIARDQYGMLIREFQGIPWIVDDHITNTETAASGAYTAKTGGANTTIFILTFEPKACCGIQGPNSIETIELGDLETKDATRTRLRWYCGLMFQDLRSCAKVDGIATGSAVTA